MLKPVAEWSPNQPVQYLSQHCGDWGREHMYFSLDPIYDALTEINADILTDAEHSLFLYI